MPSTQGARCLLLCVFAVMLPGRIASAQAADPLPRDELYRKLNAASVEVFVGRRMTGSGSVVDPVGLVLTAAHVIAPAGRGITIRVADGKPLAATLVAVDVGHDLALLQLAGRRSDYASLRLAKAQPPVGSRVYQFGGPLFRHAVMLPGTVARPATTFEYVDGHYLEVVHVAAASAKGLSGAPWTTEAGEVWGVQSSTLSLGNAQQGVSFVAPTAAISNLLATKRSPATTTLGTAVEELAEQPLAVLDRIDPRVTAGLVLKHVRSDGPASRAGLGDGEILIAAEGHALIMRDDLLRIVRGGRVGQTLELTLLDAEGHNRRKVKVTLTAIETSQTKTLTRAK